MCIVICAELELTFCHLENLRYLFGGDNRASKMKEIQLILLLLCAIFWTGAHSFGNTYWQYRGHLERTRVQSVHEHLESQRRYSQLPSEYTDRRYDDRFYEQPLDHFDTFVTATYKQRYWVNADYWDAPQGPVFLYIGGEGALTSLTVQSGEHVDLAQKYRALILAVEHRYYGESINEDGLELENMQYLSSQQALADLARFHGFASSQYNLTSANIWVCFGGSYPGALSAWFRVKYPHLVHGAIASSAPVRAKVNFEGYNDVVAASLSDPLVNGSRECAAKIRQAFRTVDEMITAGKLSDLSRDVASCKPLDGDNPADLYQLASNLADIFMGTVQYNGETPGMTVATICERMAGEGRPYDKLMVLNKEFLKTSDQNCTDNSWASYLRQLRDTSLAAIVGVGMRQWTYQTCTQFGYYQTCDANTTCLFSERLSLPPNLDICRTVFNISGDTVYSRVRFTNDYYGGGTPRGTRIVFVNGSIDPWHALSVLRDLSATEMAIYIPGTAHCANMAAAKQSDSRAMKLAKQKIDNQIGKWLAEAGYKVKGHHIPLYKLIQASYKGVQIL